MHQSILLERALSFIKEIGIRVHFGSVEETCFLPGLKIDSGELTVDKEKLKYPGDILHEAAHIAVVPAAERTTLSPTSIAERPNSDAEEMMAIAWSYAACVHLEIDASFVFHEHGYQAGGADILDNFRQGRFFAVPMLQWAGMTIEKKNANAPADAVYPKMKKWLRE